MHRETRIDTSKARDEMVFEGRNFFFGRVGAVHMRRDELVVDRGCVVDDTDTLRAGKAILAVVVFRFKNSRDRVTSASACSVKTVA